MKIEIYDPIKELREILTNLAEQHDCQNYLKMEMAINQLIVTEMRLCETEFLVLHPNQLYRFTVDPNCENCKRLEEMSKL